MSPQSASPTPRSLSITSLGLATSLGTDVAAVCAAARAGIVRSGRLEPFMVRDPITGDMEPALGHPVARLTHGFVGMARLARLGALALEPMIARGDLKPGDMRETALVLALGSDYFLDAAFAVDEADGDEPLSNMPPTPSEESEERRATIDTWLVPRMLEQISLSPPIEKHLIMEDQAGAALALDHARALIESGRVRRCLVGAIDSYCDPRMLDAIQGLDLLKAPTNSVGLMPGEAAAFIVVEQSGVPAARASVNGGSICFTASGRHQLAPNAHGCTSLGETVMRSYRDARVGPVWVVGTHNGTAWGAEEWGRALPRLPRPVVEARQWYPALSFGDTGAAAGLLAACMAVLALERGYAPAETMLAWGSSPRGPKGAFCISAAGL